MNSFTKHLKQVATLLIALVLAACNGEDNNNEDFSDATAYRANSKHAPVLSSCATAQNNQSYCALKTLPLIGMETDSPTIEDILDRVLVSHQWMGERFEALLNAYPAEMLPLFKGVTAIVIDDDIRPAFYSTGTGAIYLDPAFLWLTVEEKATINPKQDYRAGFDDPLAFRQVQRYLVEGEPAYRTGSLTDGSVRELDDILLLAGRLLLHELAHANDFLPPDTYSSINRDLSVLDAASEQRDLWLSTQLAETMPLSSDTMYSLASVMYIGTTPTLEDIDIDAVSVGTAFEPDGAGDDYAYTNQFEDYAMLFETAMMKYFFNADYELAFTSVPDDPRSCEDYMIGWGVRNRIGNETVKPRAQFSADALLTDVDFSSFFQSIDGQTEISGDWCLAAPSTNFSEKSGHSHEISPIERLRPYL